MTVVFQSPQADIFLSGSEAIVNPVNCVGTMGKGLALEFKNRFPALFQAYRRACDLGTLRPGGLLACEVIPLAKEGSLKWVVNLATKDHWRDPSKLEWIEEGAKGLHRWALEQGVRSIACPALGAGYGQLAWDEVRKVIEREFVGPTVELELYPPHEVLAPRRTPRAGQ